MSIEIEDQIKTKNETSAPQKYKLIFLNDNTTTFDFVMFLLTEYIGNSEDEAYDKTLQVHHEGKAVVKVSILAEIQAVYNEIMKEAKEEGFEFKCVIEPE